MRAVGAGVPRSPSDVAREYLEPDPPWKERIMGVATKCAHAIDKADMPHAQAHMQSHLEDLTSELRGEIRAAAGSIHRRRDPAAMELVAPKS